MSARMGRSSPYIDSLAIGISALCLIHCLFLPILLVLVPAVVADVFTNEAIHKWLVFIILPTSIVALSLGCKQHKRWHFFIIGSVGICLLLMGLMVDLFSLAPIWEEILTVLGTLCIASAHFLNYRTCRASESCACNAT